MKRLGVIGGLGTAESNDFCLAVSNNLRSKTGVQAHICLEHLPISLAEEEKFIRGEETQEHLILLRQAVHQLNNAGVDFIAIPCNTVHLFLEELRALSHVPIVSMVEECVKECQRQNITTIGLLASTRTVQERLFETALQEKNIRLICPSEQDQQKISDIILKTLQGQCTSLDHFSFFSVVNTLQKQGCKAVLFGCTNLSAFVEIKEPNLLIIDSHTILQQATIAALLS